MRRKSAISSLFCAPPAGIRRRLHSFWASSARHLRARSNDSIFPSNLSEAVMKTLLASFVMLAAAAATTPQAPVGYRFDEVKHTVVLKSGSQESPAAKGLRAQSGDRVHTGLFSYALIAAEQHRARFEIFGSTDVQLAGGTPGVILSLERGRIHALFDKITGSEPRIVQTPGALLAVRGTQYNVEVDDSGRATLDVFEGTVEVQSPLRPAPIFVHAG